MLALEVLQLCQRDRDMEWRGGHSVMGTWRRGAKGSGTEETSREGRVVEAGF